MASEKIEFTESSPVPEGAELQFYTRRVSEAVINANIAPEKLTPEEHKDIILLQKIAALLINQANSRLN